MKRSLFVFSVLCVFFTSSTNANADIYYDENVTNNVIFGSGNANGYFTIDRVNGQYGIELGLRGKLRHAENGLPQNTFNSNGDGTYSFDAGVAPNQSFPTAVWSFEWSINSNYTGPGVGEDFLISDFNYELGFDSDPGLGTSFTTFDPVNGVNPGNNQVLWDHSFGDNSTAEGAGIEASTQSVYLDLLNNSDYNLVQNSWKPSWFLSGFDPTVDGTYDFYLAALDGSDVLAKTEMQIIVGNPVPIPGAAFLFVPGLGLFAWIRRKARS